MGGYFWSVLIWRTQRASEAFRRTLVAAGRPQRQLESRALEPAGRPSEGGGAGERNTQRSDGIS